jgi:hypothetical protein
MTLQSMTPRIVIMQRSRDVKQAKDIQKRIARRMDAWEESKFFMRVQDTERTLESFLSTKRGGEVATEQRAKIFCKGTCEVFD